MEGLSWDLSLAEIADCLEDLLVENGEERLTGEVIQWWLDGIVDLSTRKAARKLADVVMKRCNEGTWKSKRVFLRPVNSVRGDSSQCAKD